MRTKKALEKPVVHHRSPLTEQQLCKITGKASAPRSRRSSRRSRGHRGRALGPYSSSRSPNGWQFARARRTPPSSEALLRAHDHALVTASLETLSIIGYKQPLTRAEIEDIRGVEVIAALETLLEKKFVKVVGRKESVGRPLLIRHTPEFLRHFGLKASRIPSIESFVVEAAPPAGRRPRDLQPSSLALAAKLRPRKRRRRFWRLRRPSPRPKRRPSPRRARVGAGADIWADDSVEPPVGVKILQRQ